jgi:hypothetical protein
MLNHTFTIFMVYVISKNSFINSFRTVYKQRKLRDEPLNIWKGGGGIFLCMILFHTSTVGRIIFFDYISLQDIFSMYDLKNFSRKVWWRGEGAVIVRDKRNVINLDEYNNPVNSCGAFLHKYTALIQRMFLP